MMRSVLQTLLPAGRRTAAKISHGGGGSVSPVVVWYTLPLTVMMCPSTIRITLVHQGLEGQRGEMATTGVLCVANLLLTLLYTPKGGFIQRPPPRGSQS